MESLLNLSPLDGRYVEKCKALRHTASEFGLLRFRLQAEIAWFIWLSEQSDIEECPALDEPTKQYLQDLLQHFNLDDALHIKEIERITNHDVKAVEYFIKEKFRSHPTLKSQCSFIHFACTSEDINNIAYSLMVGEALTITLQELDLLQKQLLELSQKYLAVPLLALTHGQPASPTTLGKEFANIHHRLKLQTHSLKKIIPYAKINGAVGNFNAHVIAYPNVNWPKVAQSFIESLGLCYNPLTTQIEPHDHLSMVFDNLCRVNTILIDTSRDLWGYISRGLFTLKIKPGEVGSSTMPHKINPIDFENAEGNLGVSIALMSHMARKLPLSRFQRDLSDSTVLRNLGSAFGYCLISYQAFNHGLSKLQPNLEAIESELKNRWDVLTEAVQTVMRRYGIVDSYEQLKTLSQGKALDQTTLHDFIKTLSLPEDAKTRLLALSPQDYIGLAIEMGENTINTN